MKKQMVIIAIMSMMVTLAGCGETKDINSITKESKAESVTATESQAVESSEADTPVESAPDESKADESKPDESKSDESKPTEIIPDVSKADEKKDQPEGKKAAVADVANILGEWEEVANENVRTLTVNSDGGFELKIDSELITSGSVTVETKDGVKKYSFITPDKGLWYVPFELDVVDAGTILRTEENQAFDTVMFLRSSGGSGNAGITEADLSPVLGTWYEEDAAIGRTLTVNNDGSFTVYNSDGGTENGRVTKGEANIYDFNGDGGLWYSLYLIDEGSQQLVQSSMDNLYYTASFGRSPSTVSTAGAIDKIVGEWHPTDAGDESTLTVNSDGSYSINYADGIAKTNTVGIGVRDGVLKYTFHDDMLGTWLVPFELRTEGGQEILVTEDNPVFGIISYTR